MPSDDHSDARPATTAPTEATQLQDLAREATQALRDAPSTGRLQPGSAVGRYLVVGYVGGGGMGVVYAAFDPQLDRKIALKLLRAPLGASGESSGADSRLLREAQAMARLSHPNVVSVHDVGTIDGQAFVAMEFVDGGTLRSWRTERTRGWREVIEAYTKAGQGLAAAHAAGLVHRDFKPDNVLVGTDGQVRVVDFGLAREAHLGEGEEGGRIEVPQSSSGGALSTPLTLPGSIMGTPAYMAPEQHLGQPTDARTDQFSFCVALYEALYGERPFQGRTREDFAAQVVLGRIEDPPQGAAVPAGIRRVVLRGLNPDPASRYPSMAELLRDLRWDPEMTRRRRLVALGATLAIGAVVATVLVARSGLDRTCRGAERKLTGVWDDGRRREIRRSMLATGVPYAAAAFAGVRRTLDRYTGAWIKMHTSACEATRVRREQSEDLLDRRMACLDRRLQEVRSLGEILSRADGRVIARAVQAAQSLSALSTCADAAVLMALVKPPADAKRRAKVSTIRAQIARSKTLHDAGRYKRGLGVASAATAAAASTRYPPILAEAQLELGRLQARLGRFADSERTLFSAWLSAQRGRHDRIAAEIAAVKVVVEGYRMARHQRGARWARIANATLERLGGDDRVASALATYQGLIKNAQGRYAQALAHHRRALAIYERTKEEGDLNRARALNNIGIAQRRLGKYADALSSLRRSLRLLRKGLGKGHPRIANLHTNLGLVFADRGNLEDAARSHRRALEIYRGALGTRHPRVGTALLNLGWVAVEMGRYKEAISQLRKALRIFRSAHGQRHPSVALCLRNLAHALTEAGRPVEALTKVGKALEIWRARGPSSEADLALGLLTKGWALHRLKRWPPALEALRSALAIRRKVLGAEHALVADTRFRIGELLLASGRAREAARELEAAEAILARAGTAPAELAGTRFALARAIWASGTGRPRALGLARQAYEILRRAGPIFRPRRDRVAAWIRRVGAKVVPAQTRR